MRTDGVSTAAPPVWSFIGADAVAQMTETELPRLPAHLPSDARPLPTGAAAALIDLEPQLPADTRIGGYSLKSLLGDPRVRDVDPPPRHRVGLGRTEEPVAAPVMRTMAELAVQTLPSRSRPRATTYPGRTACVVLTGPGGATGRSPARRPNRRRGPRRRAPRAGVRALPAVRRPARWSTRCRSRSTATPSSAARWSTRPPHSPACRPFVVREAAEAFTPGARGSTSEAGDPRRRQPSSCSTTPSGCPTCALGFAVFIAEAVAILVYLHASPNGPHRACSPRSPRSACAHRRVVVSRCFARSLASRGAPASH